MQERAKAQGWNLNIESSPGNGTRVRVEVKGS
jgi:signal transduction histidine kinase